MLCVINDYIHLNDYIRQIKEWGRFWLDWRWYDSHIIIIILIFNPQGGVAR